MLCDQTDVEQLGLLDFDDPADPTVAQFIAVASARFEQLAGRTFGLESGIVETHDGRSRPKLRLEKWPIVAVTEVVEDGTVLTEGVDFLTYPDGGYLIRGTQDYDLRWSGRRQGVQVTYDAGYATIPPLIVGVVAGLVVRAFMAAAVCASVPVEAIGIKMAQLEGSDQVEYREIVAEAVGSMMFTDDEIKVAKSFRRRGFAT